MPDSATWARLPSWSVLDTEFGTGELFFQTCRTWEADSNRPAVLHYVALCESVCRKEDLLAGAVDTDGSIRQALSEQWHGLLPGFHRFLLCKSKVILTLCVGDKLSLLKAQRFLANAVELYKPSLSPSDLGWFIKSLAKCCQRGTLIHLQGCVEGDNRDVLTALQANGFEMNTEGDSPDSFSSKKIRGTYQPKWHIKRSPTFKRPLPVQRCAIVGAGLAGASVAASLSRRGWEVTVLEMGSSHASGASGLPVGLVNPHVSSDDCTLSQLSRAGVRLTLQQADELLIKGNDWSLTGVFEMQVGGTPKLPSDWSHIGNEWSQQHQMTSENGWSAGGIYHRQGGWVKPERLIAAWLNSPKVTLKTNSTVHTMFYQAGLWVLQDSNGKTLAEAERVIFANACGAFDLLARLRTGGDAHFEAVHRIPASTGMRGLLSWSTHESDQGLFETIPINGSGSVIPHIPSLKGLAWYMGSTYQPVNQPERLDQDNHALNLAHLSALSPSLASQFRHRFESGSMSAWKGTRCVMKDRMPVVGALDEGDFPSVWICAGLGSRGLSFSVLCAELLAAQIGAEPWPIAPKLAKTLHLLRN